MNPFLLAPAERLADWRQFRKSLTAMSEHDQLRAVAQYWAQAPLLPSLPPLWALNHTNTPTIWQMIDENRWSRNSVAIGMEATLRLAGMSVDRMTLQLVHHRNDLLVLVIDDRWMLNYDWGCLTDHSKDLPIIHQWRFDGRNYSTLDG